MVAIANSTIGFNTSIVDFSIPTDALSTRRAQALARLYDSCAATEPSTNDLAVPSSPVLVPPMTAYAATQPYCSCGYASTGSAAEASTFFELALHRGTRRAASMERLLSTDPIARAHFESAVGGNVSGFSTDGTMVIQRYAANQNASVGVTANPMAGTIMGSLFAMDQAIMESAGQLGMQSIGEGYYGYTAGGLANIAGAYDNSGVLGGQGFGSWNPNAMPGLINNTNPSYESAHQAELANLLADPSLTVEDKVTLMIMLIMNKMDQDIERQAQYINSIQQQQSARGNSGAQASGLTGESTSSGGTESPSIDVETMKLKRMIDKRSQMFDMLRQIIDKYNQTAKGIIDAIGR